MNQLAAAQPRSHRKNSLDRIYRMNGIIHRRDVGKMGGESSQKDRERKEGIGARLCRRPAAAQPRVHVAADILSAVGGGILPPDRGRIFQRIGSFKAGFRRAGSPTPQLQTRSDKMNRIPT